MKLPRRSGAVRWRAVPDRPPGVDQRGCSFTIHALIYSSIHSCRPGFRPYALVAQLDRVSASEAEGCGFDPRRAQFPEWDIRPRPWRRSPQASAARRWPLPRVPKSLPPRRGTYPDEPSPNPTKQKAAMFTGSRTRASPSTGWGDQYSSYCCRSASHAASSGAVSASRSPGVAAASSTHSRSSGAAVDHVDGQLAELVFVGEIAPQRIVRIEPPDRLERQRLQPPGLERLVIVARVLGVDLHAVAELADVLVEGRLEPAVAQRGSRPATAARAPASRRSRARASMSGAPNSSSGRVVPRPSRQRRALEHHRAGIGARHPQVRRVGAGIDPGALAERPAEAGRGVGPPALHLDDAVVDVELEVRRRTSGRARRASGRGASASARRRRSSPSPAAASGLRPAGRGVGPVEHPDRLAVLRRRLEHVAQRGDEGVDAAAEVLQVDQQDVERVHHLRRSAGAPRRRG